MYELILDVLKKHRMVRMFEIEDGALGNSYPLIDRLCLDDGADVESGQVEADAIARAIADKLHSLEKDASRYRWLQKEADRDYVQFSDSFNNNVYECKEALDEAIDNSITLEEITK